MDTSYALAILTVLGWIFICGVRVTWRKGSQSQVATTGDLIREVFGPVTRPVKRVIGKALNKLLDAALRRAQQKTQKAPKA